jgi:hypothetical protein
MGFGDREIVALCGAHALGRCHRDRSGFDGYVMYHDELHLHASFINAGEEIDGEQRLTSLIGMHTSFPSPAFTGHGHMHQPHSVMNTSAYWLRRNGHQRNGMGK